MQSFLEISNDKNAGTEPIHLENNLLINQLHAVNRTFASFILVIIHASEMLTKGYGKNDFIHSEAVHQRLSELLPDAHTFGLNEAEIFILIACAYLHDIGHLYDNSEKKHGEASAKKINECDSLKYLFPGSDIQNQVARICHYHDREINELRELEDKIKLDFRPSYHFKCENKTIRLRMLSAVFRLADELECNSDRMLSQSTNMGDPRTIIAGVRINLELRSIVYDFKQGSTEENRKKCLDHLRGTLDKLHTFLNPYELSFKIVDKLPETILIGEEEEVETKLNIFDDVKKGSSSFTKPQQATNYDKLIEMYKIDRLDRIESVISILTERGRIE